MASKRGNTNPIELKNEERLREKANRGLKRNKSGKKSRQRDWLQDDNVGGFERVMPRDESERRRMVEQNKRNLAETPPIDEADDLSASARSESAGRVVEISRGMCRVEARGQVWLCHLRGALLTKEEGFSNVVAVGDWVDVGWVGEEAIVQQVFSRHNVIARPDPSNPHLRQILVANVDRLLIVAAWRNPNIWYELIDRYLIVAQRAGVEPVICVNKVDLVEDHASMEAELRIYHDLGFRVLYTSTLTGQGISELETVLHTGITTLTGLSGAGKSSLLRSIQPDFDLKTGLVSDDSGQGRHTTTQSNMLPFANGYVIDTPGIREFGLAGLTRSELATFYPDLPHHACRFADCTHQQEPGCAILAGVAQGTVSPTRHKTYCKLWRTLSE
ncbi:MAG: ribosome small subunit-dependent GTPase A [Phototrophicaceae bacterium]